MDRPGEAWIKSERRAGTCFYCTWWLAHIPIGGKRPAVTGRCQFYPPVILAHDPEGADTARWPVTFHSDRCSEFDDGREEHQPQQVNRKISRSPARRKGMP